MSTNTITRRLNIAAERSANTLYEDLHTLTEQTLHYSLMLHSKEFERFEFHGDSRLSAEIKQIIVNMHAFMDPNFMTLISQNCVCNANLTDVFDELGLHKLLSPTIKLSSKDKADVIEAILGELYEHMDQTQNKSVYDCLIHYIYHRGYMRAALCMQKQPRKIKYYMEINLGHNKITSKLCGGVLKRKYKMRNIGYVQVDAFNIAHVPLTQEDAQTAADLRYLYLDEKYYTFKVVEYDQPSKYQLIIQNLPEQINMSCLVAVIKGKYNLKGIGMIKIDKDKDTACIPILNGGVARATHLKQIVFTYKQVSYTCKVILAKV